MKNWNTIKNVAIQFVIFVAAPFLARIVFNLLFGWGGEFPGYDEVPWWQGLVRLLFGLTVFNLEERFRQRKNNEREKEEVYQQYKEAFDEFDEKTKGAE